MIDDCPLSLLFRFQSVWQKQNPNKRITKKILKNHIQELREFFLVQRKYDRNISTRDRRDGQDPSDEFFWRKATH